MNLGNLLTMNLINCNDLQNILKLDSSTSCNKNVHILVRNTIKFELMEQEKFPATKSSTNV